MCEGTHDLVQERVYELQEEHPLFSSIGSYTFSGFKGTEKIYQIQSEQLAERNFSNSETPSKPHLVRGIFFFTFLLTFFPFLSTLLLSSPFFFSFPK